MPQRAGSAHELWTRIDTLAQSALAGGALHRIASDARTIADGGVEFVVRRATEPRQEEPRAPRPQRDPFAQPEPELFVGDLSTTHFALLNKYNVLDRHLLVVTREYVAQEALLDETDFDALAACMAGQPVLGFYNGGVLAGASQPHKHLQVVRLPLSPRSSLPIEALIAGAGPTLDGLPLRHAFARLPEDLGARDLFHRYRELLDAADSVSRPYNLLVARGWMLLVPRSRATFEGLPVNSLAFAGALFVRNEDELQAVERAGPMAVLRGVAFPEDPT